MATVSKLFAFLNDSESYIGYPDTDMVLSYDGAIGNPAGSLKARISGRNKNGQAYWEWSGTWENLGVPSGATVTAVRLNGCSTRCTEYSTGANSSVGPYDIWDSAGTTLIATIWSGRSVTGTEGSWDNTGAQSDQTVSSTYEASNTSIKIRLHDDLRTANDANAAVTTHDDQVELVITYTEPSYNIPGATITSGIPVISGGIPSFNAEIPGATITSGIPVISGGIISQDINYQVPGATITSGIPVISGGVVSFNAQVPGDTITSGIPVISGGVVSFNAQIPGTTITSGIPVISGGVVVFNAQVPGDTITSGIPVISGGFINAHIPGATITGGIPVISGGVVSQAYQIPGATITSGIPVISGGAIGFTAEIPGTTIISGIPDIFGGAIGFIAEIPGVTIISGIPDIHGGAISLGFQRPPERRRYSIPILPRIVYIDVEDHNVR